VSTAATAVFVVPRSMPMMNRDRAADSTPARPASIRSLPQLALRPASPRIEYSSFHRPRSPRPWQ
jgi:hypothetical protein